MPNPENLNKRVPFVKNDPRINRKGAPKLPEINALLSKVLGEEKDGVSAAEAILKALRLKASKGDVRAIELMLDRAYGKAPQTITHEGLPTSVTFNFTDMSGDKTDENELL
jgi:hypothetical protein